MPDAEEPRTDSNAGAVANPVEAAPAPSPNSNGEQLTAQEAKDRWLRTAADLANNRKRAARELSQARERERAAVATQFLPVLDNLELALAHAEADPHSIIDGVRAVLDEAVGVMARLGFNRRDESGVPFDPVAHEVVSVVDEPRAAPGTVVRVVRPGYGDAEHQLRPVGVTVSRPRE